MNEDFDKKLNEMSDKYGLKDKEEKEQSNPFEGYVLGISLISHTLVGIFLGYWIDKFFDSSPAGFLIFMFVGFISGFRHIWINIK